MSHKSCAEPVWSAGSTTSSMTSRPGYVRHHGQKPTDAADGKNTSTESLGLVYEASLPSFPAFLAYLSSVRLTSSGISPSCSSHSHLRPLPSCLPLSLEYYYPRPGHCRLREIDKLNFAHPHHDCQLDGRGIEACCVS